jgi:hypothetical protein
LATQRRVARQFPGASGSYKASGPKMASKNMMNHYPEQGARNLR